MFQQFEKDGNLNAYEIERLKQMERNSRVNNSIQEVFELGANIAFIIVLFVQGGFVVSLPNGWQGYSPSAGYSNCNLTVAATPQIQSKFISLGAAATAVLIFNAIWRLAIIIVPLVKWGSLIDHPLSKFYAAFSVFLSVVDPWNASLLLNTVMIRNHADNRTNRSLLMQEIAVCISLLLFESVPLLVIQIIYGWLQGFTQTISVSWTLAMTSSVIHLLSAGSEVVNLLRRLPHLIQAQGQVEDISSSGLAVANGGAA